MSETPEGGGRSEQPHEQHWLIWDGACGFCRKIVVCFQRQDTERRFRVTTYQSCPTPPMTPRLREESAQAMQVITNTGEQISGGRSVLFVLETVGWHPVLIKVARKPPIVWLVDAGYTVVAKNRQFFSRLMFRNQPTDGPAC